MKGSDLGKGEKGLYGDRRAQGVLLLKRFVDRQMGANVVIAVNVRGDKKTAQVNNIFDTILQSLNLMVIQATEAGLKEADFVIQPQVSHVGLLDFSKKRTSLGRYPGYGACFASPARKDFRPAGNRDWPIARPR